MTASRQIDALTGIRGIAAWLVVLYHIRLAFAPSLPLEVVAILGKGYLAVDLFFVLSGFVLWLTWGGRLATEGWSAVIPFLQKRIARVWPLHLTVLAATVGFALLIAASGRPLPDGYRWDELPLHVLLVQNWGFTRDIGWNDPSWSISTEVAAYLCFAAMVAVLAPAIGRIGNRLPDRRWIGAVVAIPLLACALDRFFAVNGETGLGANIAFFGLARCLAQFGCGVAMCIVWQVRDGNGFRALCATAILASCLGLANEGRETFLVPIAFTALVGLVASTSAARSNPLSSRLAVWLGEISYSTYLSHFLLWTLFKLVLVRDAADVPLALGAVFLLATLLASIVLYRFVEVPARDRLGRLPLRSSGNPRPA
jgi:peptidoglycan/LPS O-acetylase OafA/YrhL